MPNDSLYRERLAPSTGLILVIVLPNGDGGLQAPMDAPPWPTPPPMAARNVAQDQSLAALEKLAELRDRGVLSVQEFEEKKRELLDRV